MIYILRTTVGRENIVMDNLQNKIKISSANVKSVFHPEELKGYLFVEAEAEEIEKAISGVPHVRGMIKKQVPLAEIKKFLEVKKVEIKINMGDIVEITGGPFKNERGKVVRVDEAKEEITLELLEAAIPIPITVSIDSVRVVESMNEPEKKAEPKERTE